MSFEEEDSTSRTPSGASKAKKIKKKATSHNHIGPNVRAFRVGLAMCPVCDAESILRMTDTELFAQKAVKDAQRAARSTVRR